MMPTVVAMLLSAFVLPGSGQIYNGEKKKGMVFIGATLGLAFASFVALTLVMARMMPPGGGLISVLEAKAMVTRLWVEHGQMLTVFEWLFTGLWVVCVLDAFLGARAKARREAEAAAPR